MNQPAQLDHVLVRLMGGQDDLFGHTHRVADLAVALGSALGLGHDRLEPLRLAARLHDVGKLEIDQTVLSRRRPLLPNELGEIRRHPQLGFAMLAGVVADEVAAAVLHHHERWDGRGYPHGLAGASIPLASRIILVADAFDAMTSDRCYQPPQSVAYALDEILLHRGGQFDPLIADEFVRLVMDRTLPTSVAADLIA